MTKVDYLIIGAGLSGLWLAHHLKGKIIILEKSRGVGGRIATRRIEDLGFDHGALYLENKNSVIEALSKSSIKYQATQDGIFCSGGMTTLPKKLAQSLDIRKETRATALTKTSEGWKVDTDKDESFEAPVVILTAPMPQALELIDKSHIPYKKDLKEISYDKAIMALLVCDRDAYPDRLSTHLHSITPMSRRGLHPTGFVVRATPAFSEAHFDQPDERNLKLLIEDFSASFSEAPAIRHSELKKWRYVVPQACLQRAFEEIDHGLFLTGDSFFSPGASGAIGSANALIAKLT